MEKSQAIKHWVAKLEHSDLPALKQTQRLLKAQDSDDGSLAIKSVADILAQDPIMTVKLIRYLQQHKKGTQTTEIIQIEQALLMLGLKQFNTHIPPTPLVEELLANHREALPPVLRVIHRVYRASIYAKVWAVRLHDMHFEEVRVAALLHDIAEILMWCFAPEEMLYIRDQQEKNRRIRSRDIQTEVFGFALHELQLLIAQRWRLPELLVTLMSDQHHNSPRVRNVVLAVNLARHSANGWDDAALPDDYFEIGQLLRISSDQVRSIL